MIDQSLNPRAVRVLGEIAAGDCEYPPMWALAGVELLEATPGRILMRARADERHLNAFGGVHGGYAATVLDTALGLTIFISIDEQARHTTVDLAVKIVRPFPLGEWLDVETRLANVSRSVGVSQGEVRNAAGRVCAHGTTTCHIKR